MCICADLVRNCNLLVLGLPAAQLESVCLKVNNVWMNRSALIIQNMKQHILYSNDEATMAYVCMVQSVANRSLLLINNVSSVIFYFQY